MKMSSVKIPKLSDIYYFCSKLLSKEDSGKESIQLVQSNILDVKRLGSFLQHPWPLDKRVNEPDILPFKAAYLTYHLFEGCYFSQRKFLFSLWCGISMMEFNGVKMDKKMAQKNLKKMMRLYSRKRGPIFCKDLLKEFFLDSFSKKDKFKSFGKVGQLFPRLI
jgi:hypothetical protein